MAENRKDPTKARQINEVDEKRRRLVKGAAGAAPVMLSIAHRPVWAGSRCTYSGQLSGNLSAPEETCGGEACSPGFFKTHPSLWHPDFPPEALYDTVFGFGPGGSPFPGMSLYQVIKLKEGGYDPDSIAYPAGCDSTGCKQAVVMLGFHSVAALQNAATSVSYRYTVEEVIRMTRMAFESGDKDEIEGCKGIFEWMHDNLGCPL